MKTKRSKKQILKLKGKAVVFIDWANVYGWSKSLEHPVSPRKLFKLVNTYKEVEKINLYFGTDTHPKSRAFIGSLKKIGYRVVTKAVKHIVVDKVKGKIITQRKCDFDMEICLDICLKYKNYDSFIFLSGDGDFEPLYRHLIKQKRQVIVVYQPGHLGREVWKLKRGIYKTEIKKLGDSFDRRKTKKA